MLYPIELLAHLEAPIGFEPTILGLQPSALPLGYGVKWWQQQDSNLRLTAYEAVLEPSPVILPFGAGGGT